MGKKNTRLHRIQREHLDVPHKANRILHLILIAFLLIGVRVGHLAFIDRDQKLDDSLRSRKKTILEPAARGIIRDRFGTPLATNKVSYQATVLYSQLKEIPTTGWETDAVGTRIKIPLRKRYIHELSSLLGKELQLDSERVEDLIYAKASYYTHQPFVLKDDLSEQEYYRLKALEREWPGVFARKMPKRHYPQGKTAGNILGFIGAINRTEYDAILQEIHSLEELIQEQEGDAEPPALMDAATLEELHERLERLKKYAYTVNDYVGKEGIEKTFEKLLRGYKGKQCFYTDPHGHRIQESEDSTPPVHGSEIRIALCSELQAYAEQLLAQNETIREVRLSRLRGEKKTIISKKHPWIKGGAIIVMEPRSGEILTMASYPRMDPNDFIQSGNQEVQKQKLLGVHRWLENQAYIASLWNQATPLARERFDPLRGSFYQETCWIDWRRYVDFILLPDTPLHHRTVALTTMGELFEAQQAIQRLKAAASPVPLAQVIALLYPTEGQSKKTLSSQAILEGKQFIEKNQEAVCAFKKSMHPWLAPLETHEERMLWIDIHLLPFDVTRFSQALRGALKEESLSAYIKERGAFYRLSSRCKEACRSLYHTTEHAQWREKEGKEFLKQKRSEEKQNKTYAKPYLDYFDQKEQTDFHRLWQEHALDALVIALGFQDATSSSFSEAYVEALKGLATSWEKGEHLSQELKNDYALLRTRLSHLPREGQREYLATFWFFDDLTFPLEGQYRFAHSKKSPQGKDLAAAFYPTHGYGTINSPAYRQAAIQGSLFKIVTGYAALMKQYEKKRGQLLSIADLNPLTIFDHVFQEGGVTYVGRTKEGKPIPQLYQGGRLPRSLAHQNIGKVDLIQAMEMSSNPYFALLAGECLEDPDELLQAASLFGYGTKTGIELPREIAGQLPKDLSTNKTGLYATAIGQHSLVVSPLQTAVMLATLANGGKRVAPTILCSSYPASSSQIALPHEVRNYLLRGLKAGTLRAYRENFSSLTRLYKTTPEAIRCHQELHEQMLGKTSTAEVVEQMDLDPTQGTNLYTHVWFGAISFSPHSKTLASNAKILRDEYGTPELVVVIYLKYGGYGKEAAPLAAQIISKWRAIRDQHASHM